MGDPKKDLDFLMKKFPRSSSMPLLSWDTSPFQGALPELTTDDLAFQRRPSTSLLQGLTSAGDINFERKASASCLQESAGSVDIQGRAFASFSNSGVSNLSSPIIGSRRPPSQISQVLLSQAYNLNQKPQGLDPASSLLQPNNEAAVCDALAGLQLNDTTLMRSFRQYCEDKAVPAHHGFHDGSMIPSLIKEEGYKGSLQAPGYGILANNCGVAPLPVEESYMKRVPTSNNILGRELLSIRRSPSQGHILGNEALSMKSLSNGIMGTEMSSMMRSTSTSKYPETEISSVKRCPSSGTFGIEASSMKRSPHNGLFGDKVSYVKPTFSNGNIGHTGFSSVRNCETRASFLQDHEERIKILKEDFDAERPQALHSKQQELHTRDYKLFEASPFISGDCRGLASNTGT